MRYVGDHAAQNAAHFDETVLRCAHTTLSDWPLVQRLLLLLGVPMPEKQRHQIELRLRRLCEFVADLPSR